MIRRILVSLVCLLGLSSSAFAGTAKETAVGIVNFATCITESKIGKKEQASFESLKNQLSKSLEGLEKQINEISTKFNDKEYLDGLSPEAEDEMKNKFRSLNEELSRNQNQYYQLLNQAHMRIIQLISANINQAAEKIATEKKLTLILNKEVAFFYAPSLDVTSEVITQMDQNFEETQSKNEAPKEEAKPKEATK